MELTIYYTVLCTKLPKLFAIWRHVPIMQAMKVKGALGFLRAWAQVSALGPAMLPEEQGSMRAFAQSGFDINGLHTKTLKRHWITTEKAHNKQNRITKENKSRGDSWHLKETFFSSLSYADIFKETSGFLFFRLQRKYPISLFFSRRFICNFNRQ